MKNHLPLLGRQTTQPRARTTFVGAIDPADLSSELVTFVLDDSNNRLWRMTWTAGVRWPDVTPQAPNFMKTTLSIKLSIV